MTESELRKQYVSKAESYLGTKQGSAKHEEIVAAYNSYLPHPRGYVLTDTDYWCAAFESAIAIMCDMTDIIPVECSCNEQIKLWQRMGRWEERDDYVPYPGDLIYYDWDDKGDGDDKGAADHVGIVVRVMDDDILVIEGNKNKCVAHRHVSVDGIYIRGFGLPDFASKADDTPSGMCSVDLPILQYGAKGEAVRALQTLLNLRTATSLKLDASFGPATLQEVKAYQDFNGLVVDGSVGPITWGKLVNC